MSNFDELYAGLQKEADNSRFFMERANDFLSFKKMAGPQSSESGGTPLEDQPQPHALTHCPGCAQARSACSCEEAAKEAGMSHGEFEGRFMKGVDPKKKADFKKKYLTKKAHLPANPTSVDSSVNARMGALSAVVKVAEDGTNNFMSDIKGRAADRYPVSEVPSISDEALALAGAAKKKMIEAKKARAQFIGGTKPRAISSPIPVPEKYKVAGIGAVAKASAILPKSLRDPKSLPMIGLAALGLGTANYLSSRPQKSLGGKSRAEQGLQADVLANKARATDDDGLPTRMRHRMKEFQSGLATDFRKSPAAAAGIGALIGGGIGAKLVRVLGGIR